MKSNVLLVVLMLVLAVTGTAQEKGTFGLLFKTGAMYQQKSTQWTLKRSGIGLVFYL